MDKNLKKIDDENMSQIAGGTDSSTFKFKFKDHVRSISNPSLGEGVIVHMGVIEGAVVCAVNFGNEVLTLPQDDLMLA